MTMYYRTTLHDNVNGTATQGRAMERHEQFAEAYEHVAKVNHYMVGIVETGTWDELCEAEQLLITAQNAEAAGSERYLVLDLALDLIQRDIKAALKLT